MKKNKHKKETVRLVQVIWVLIAISIVTLAGMALYFTISYADSVGVDKSRVQELEKNSAVLLTKNTEYYSLFSVPSSSETGLVIVPGAFMDPMAYITRYAPLVNGGKLKLFVTRSPLNYAPLATNQINSIVTQNPSVKKWYVAGHNLGGEVTCSYAAENQSRVSGLILLGSSCRNNISEKNIRVLDISGSNDGISTPGEVLTSAKDLPSDSKFVEIMGANHGSFGDFNRTLSGDGQVSTDLVVISTQLMMAIERFVSGN